MRHKDWVEHRFDSDVDDDDFIGFHNDWILKDFTARHKIGCNLTGGMSVQHPEEASPIHYFDLLWDDELWQHMVTETNWYFST